MKILRDADNPALGSFVAMKVRMRSVFSHRRVLLAAIGLVLAMALPRAASAATLYFYAPGAVAPNLAGDLGDLDHHNVYTWLIQNVNTLIPNGTTITGAKLHIDNIYNWDASANRLYLALLNSANTTTNTTTVGVGTLTRLASGTTGGNTALSSAVYETVDSTVATPTQANWQDDLSRVNTGSPCTTNYSDSSKCLSVAGQTLIGGSAADTTTGDTAIGNYFDTATYTTPSNGSLAEGWAQGTGTGADSTHSFGSPTQAPTYDYTLDLTPWITNLSGYIANGGDIAIGLDPDCHFFNDGVWLEITTGFSTQSTVPEPASWTLVGLGLAAMYQRMRSKKSAA